MNDETSKGLGGGMVGGSGHGPGAGVNQGGGYAPAPGESLGTRATGGLAKQGQSDDHAKNPGRIPDTVLGSARDLYALANNSRGRLKGEAAEVKRLAQLAKASPPPQGEPREDRGETIANLMIAYRHLEDASMRLGKVLQSIDGGVSVYDRDTTVGVQDGR